MCNILCVWSVENRYIRRFVHGGEVASNMALIGSTNYLLACLFCSPLVDLWSHGFSLVSVQAYEMNWVPRCGAGMGWGFWNRCKHTETSGLTRSAGGLALWHGWFGVVGGHFPGGAWGQWRHSVPSEGWLLETLCGDFSGDSFGSLACHLVLAGKLLACRWSLLLA